eukprot:1148812-Pelagomonas_calceolata.AAC.2
MARKAVCCADMLLTCQRPLHVDWVTHHGCCELASTTHLALHRTAGNLASTPHQHVIQQGTVCVPGIHTPCKT